MSWYLCKYMKELPLSFLPWTCSLAMYVYLWVHTHLLTLWKKKCKRSFKVSFPVEHHCQWVLQHGSHVPFFSPSPELDKIKWIFFLFHWKRPRWWLSFCLPVKKMVEILDWYWAEATKASFLPSVTWQWDWLRPAPVVLRAELKLQKEAEVVPARGVLQWRA